MTRAQLEREIAKRLANDESAQPGPAAAPLPPGVKLSTRANPPIAAAEVATAINSVCLFHNPDCKLLWNPHNLKDMHGRVYFCKVGKSYWRMHYPWGGKGRQLPPIVYPPRRVV